MGFLQGLDLNFVLLQVFIKLIYEIEFHEVNIPCFQVNLLQKQFDITFFCDSLDLFNALHVETVIHVHLQKREFDLRQSPYFFVELFQDFQNGQVDLLFKFLLLQLHDGLYEQNVDELRANPEQLFAAFHREHGRRG